MSIFLTLTSALAPMAFCTILMAALPQSYASASTSFCSPRISKMKISGKEKLEVGEFQALAAQGSLIFINGPEESFKKSEALINNFCHRGFSVYAFDLLSKKKNESTYMATIDRLVKLAQRRNGRLPMMIYGWSKGADLAAKYSRTHPRKIARLILENPNLPVLKSAVTTRIFACSSPLKSHRKLLVLRPSNGRSCQKRISANIEAIDPMVDYLESDFAGVQTESWYWRKI